MTNNVMKKNIINKFIFAGLAALAFTACGEPDDEITSNNYSRILGRWRTYPTNLELLISSFETWQRMVEKGYDTVEGAVKSCACGHEH